MGGIALYKAGDKPICYQNLEFYQGWLPVDLDPLPEEWKLLHWKGPVIAQDVLDSVKAFFLWTQKEHHTEAVVRLYFHEINQQWRAVVLPQEISGGLSVHELKDHSDRAQSLAEVSAHGWYEVGTIHHHCSASAFQSGTDHDDEITRNGVQITLGNLESAAWTWHARGCFRGMLFQVDIREWVGDESFLTKPPETGDLFPEEWKSRMIPRVVYTPTAYDRMAGYNRAGFGWDGYTGRLDQDEFDFNSREVRTASEWRSEVEGAAAEIAAEERLDKELEEAESQEALLASIDDFLSDTGIGDLVDRGLAKVAASEIIHEVGKLLNRFEHRCPGANLLAILSALEDRTAYREDIIDTVKQAEAELRWYEGVGTTVETPTAT